MIQAILQKKKLILSIVFFALSLFVFVFLYRSINNNRDTLKVAEEKWQAEENYRKNVKSLASSVKTIEAKINLLETHFVKSSDVVPFLDTIEKLAKEVGVKAEVVSVNISDNEPGLLVELKAQGDFEIIYKFIKLLENSPYDIKFSSMDIQNNSVSTDKNSVWSASFHMKLLSFVI